MRLHKTRWPDVLAYGHFVGTNFYYDPKRRKQVSKHVSFWRFYDVSEGSIGAAVGPEYPSKETLLADMNRYAEEIWGLT